MKILKLLAAFLLLSPLSQVAKADLCMDSTTHAWITCPAAPALGLLGGIPNNTIVGNTSGGTAVPGALTSIPAALVPVYSGDCGNSVASATLVCTQAAGNYNVIGTLSEGALNPPTTTFAPQEIDFTGTSNSTAAPNVQWNNTTGATNYKAWNCHANSTGSNGTFACGTQTVNAAGEHDWLLVTRGGTNPYDLSDISFGSAGTSNNTTHFLGTGTITFAGLVSPTTTLGIVGTAAADQPTAGSMGEVVSLHCVVGAAAAAAATITVTIATPAVVTWSSHTFTSSTGLANYTCPINFTNSGGALPTGIVVGTNYYIIGSSVSGDTFQISDTAAHALAGTNAVATSGSQSGTQSAYIGNLGASTTSFAGAAVQLVAGDWDCSGLAEFQELTSLTTTEFANAIDTSVVVTTIGNSADIRTVTGSISTNSYYLPTPIVRANISATTGYYLVTKSTFSGGTMNEGGRIYCRRER